MLGLKGLLLVMLKSAFIVAFLSIPKPVVAFAGLKNWSRKALYTKVDLCTQSCYSQIIPGLYLSNARAAEDSDVLSHLGITHVLTVEAHRLPKHIFVGTNIKNMFIRALDSPSTDLLPYFPLSNAFIYDGLHSGNVLVHCRFGVSQSAAIVIAYLMQIYRLSFNDAFHHVKYKRKFVSISPHYIIQLKEFERLDYDVTGFKKLEAYITVYSRNKKFKTLFYIVAIIIGILVPIAVIT